MSDITDDILIAGFNNMGRDHNATLNMVLGICRWAGLKLIKDICLFQCTSIPYFVEVIQWSGVSPDPSKVRLWWQFQHLSVKKNSSHSWVYSITYVSSHKWLLRYLNPYRNLDQWKQNDHGMTIHKNSFDRTKNIIKLDTGIRFYNMFEPLYPETDAYGIGLGAGLLQVTIGINCMWEEVPDNTALCPTAFASKSLSSAEQQYSNIEWEALDILPGLGKFLHHCFAKDVNIITDHETVVLMARKDITTLITVATMHNVAYRPWNSGVNGQQRYYNSYHSGYNA